MLAARCNFNKLARLSTCICGSRIAYYRKKHTDKKYDETNAETSDERSNLKLGEMATKYRIFREEESEKILDINEERLKYAELLEEAEMKPVNPFEGINLERE